MNWDLISTDGKHYLTCNGTIASDGYDDLEYAKRLLSRFIPANHNPKLNRAAGVMDNRHRNWKRRG